MSSAGTGSRYSGSGCSASLSIALRICRLSRGDRSAFTSRTYRWTAASRAVTCAVACRNASPPSMPSPESAAIAIGACQAWRGDVLHVASATTSAATRAGSRWTISWAMLPPRLSPTRPIPSTSSTSSSATTSSTAAAKANEPGAVDSPCARRSGTTMRYRDRNTSTWADHDRWSRVAPCRKTSVGPSSSPPVQYRMVVSGRTSSCLLKKSPSCRPVGPMRCRKSGTNLRGQDMSMTNGGSPDAQPGKPSAMCISMTNGGLISFLARLHEPDHGAGTVPRPPETGAGGTPGGTARSSRIRAGSNVHCMSC